MIIIIINVFTIKNECKNKCRFSAFNATSCLLLKRTFTYFSVNVLCSFFLVSVKGSLFLGVFSIQTLE